MANYLINIFYLQSYNNHLQIKVMSMSLPFSMIGTGIILLCALILSFCNKKELIFYIKCILSILFLVFKILGINKVFTNRK